MAKLALLAGDGNLPVYCAKSAVEQGEDIIAITVTPDAQYKELQDIVDVTYQINVGQLDKIITTLQQEEVDGVIMLGKVTKELLYQGIELDERFMKLLSTLGEKNDDAIMLALVQELQQAGIQVLEQGKFIQNLLPTTGTLTTVEPTAEVLNDMKYGFKMAKEIGGLDIGQTVVVKDEAVMAVEAIEGTDQAILRGGKLGRGGVVVAKVSKPEQDLRFDIPTVGLDTLENLIKVEAKGLVIEANSTFIVHQQEFIKRANEAGITVVVMSHNS